MKEKLLILGAMVALCCSCAGNSVLLDTESELNGLNNEYELGTLEAGDNGLKCETLGDEDSIQVLKDNYIAEIMGRMEVAKEKVMRTAYGATSPRVGVFRVGSCGNYKYLSIKIDWFKSFFSLLFSFACHMVFPDDLSILPFKILFVKRFFKVFPLFLKFF